MYEWWFGKRVWRAKLPTGHFDQLKSSIPINLSRIAPMLKSAEKSSCNWDGKLSNNWNVFFFPLLNRRLQLGTCRHYKMHVLLFLYMSSKTYNKSLRVNRSYKPSAHIEFETCVAYERNRIDG